MSFDSDHHVGMFADRRADDDTGYMQPSLAAKRPEARRTPPRDDNVFRRTTYSCPELGRTCDRPGAYDAFDLPSLFDGQRKPYRFADPVTS